MCQKNADAKDAGQRDASLIGARPVDTCDRLQIIAPA